MIAIVLTGRVESSALRHVQKVLSEVLEEVRELKGFAHGFFGVQKETGGFTAVAVFHAPPRMHAKNGVLSAALRKKVEALVEKAPWPMRPSAAEEPPSSVYEVVAHTF